MIDNKYRNIYLSQHTILEFLSINSFINGNKNMFLFILKVSCLNSILI